MERILLSSDTKKGRNIRRIISFLLIAAIFVTSISLEAFIKKTEASGGYVTLYLKDDTAEHWIGNDNAVIQLVDNTYGHDRYIMTKVNSITWSCKVPASTYNVTFNRLSPDRSTQWNSWSAGGREGHSTYHATVPEHGYWDGTAMVDNEYFHEGDIVYLDFYSFIKWEQSDALFYVNFTSYSKADNNGYDITVSGADSTKISPILLTNEIETQVFKYVVTAEDEGATSLRFFRGNSSTLWNNSVVLNYSDYKAGNNCVKVQGWDNTGYVCPYVPRRHITQIDSAEIEVTGNRKINRKVEIDFNLTGETELLSQEDTLINIIKVDSNGNEIKAGEGEVFFLTDETASQWNHRELIFKQAGSYKISAVATDGYDNFSAEKIIAVTEDAAPEALFQIKCGEGESTDSQGKYVRDSEGTAHISVTDSSISELGDEISERNYVLYHDANNDGEFSDDEIIDTKTGNETEVSYELNTVGRYKSVLNIKETFTDTISSLIDDSVYLRGSYVQVFEITNQAPVSAMYMEKSRLSDIIFTVGNADKELLLKYAEVTASVEEKLGKLGIEANVSTVSTSALTAQDTFAWTEYDHYNYADWYNQCLPKHIEYNGKDIKMVGYFWAPLKDFLYVDDTDASRKVFEFDLQRDATDWHSMEGGGFLFNTVVSEEENYIQGYCILVTGSGLKLVQINKTNLSNFRNGSYYNVQNAGRLLQTFGISDLYANHHFKIIIDGNNITVFDGEKLVINEYTLPDDNVDAYGYGPIISHISHGCSQQSYFTFKNIVMQTITGESLSDVVNNHEWTPGTNHYVINLSETSVPELSDTDRMADVAAALISKDAMFFGIGNNKTIDQYNSLVNVIDGKGENISLTYPNQDVEDNEDEESEQVTVETAVDHIVARIIADIESKDYSIGYTITTDEKVTYKDTYSDPEGDKPGTEIWEYIYDSSVFGEEEAELKNILRSKPITMFTDAGAYTVTHKVSDDPTHGNDFLDSYIRWADADEYKKIILAQNRPEASVKVTMTQNPSDSSRCMVNVIYESKDPDHLSDEKNGIREEKFYYREMGETEWTEGRFPTEVIMGTIYLSRYQVRDIEGTWSRPAVQAVRTSEAREYVRPDDNTPPQCSITVSKETVETGETLYIEAVATDDYGVTDISLKVNGNEIANQPGRYSYVPYEAGELEITLMAWDICDNEGNTEKIVRVTDKSDVTPPTINITSPKNGTVTGNVDIMGSITDDKALASYRVVQSRVITREQTEENQEEIQEETVLAEGTQEIIEGKIAVVETDSLESGTYKIEITATDKAGLSSSVYMLLTVEKTESGDKIPPTAVISDITLDIENNLIEITGTVNDETELKNYVLKVYKKTGTGNDIEEILSVTGNHVKSEEILGTVSTQGLLSGDYSVILMAEDNAGNQTTTKAVFTYTAGTTGDDISRSSDTEPPVIITEINAEIKNESLNINLRGTITDENSLLYTVTLGKKQSDGSVLGALIIAAGDKGISDSQIASYSIKPYETGDYILIIEAEDEYGNLKKTEYTITVTSNGTIDEGYGGEAGGDDTEEGKGKLNLVLGRNSVSVEEIVKAYLTYPNTAKNVKLVLKNKKTKQESDIAIHGRTAEITADTYGEYEVILSADINGEKQSVSADLWFLDAGDDTHPVAEFITPESESIIKNITDITGTVSDDKELKYYTLEYKQEGTDDYIELSRGTEPVVSGTLGTLDTTKLLNGRYVLRLTAVDMAGHRIRTERYINVEGNLKVGNMSIGFTDITSNVAGIPLSLTRNYDSRNKSSGDFGTGWSMGLMDIHLKEASDICTGYSMIQTGQMLSTGYYLTQTSCHDITVTYGDGTSDRFELILSPEQQALIPIYEVRLSFKCVTNPKVKLSIYGSSTAMLYGNALLFDDYEILESPSYILTREDGTKLHLDEQHGLISMWDTNDNKVMVTNAGFKHTDGKGITFTRDEHNRIIKAEETDSSANVINKVLYAYDSDDNLISVTDNAGRTVGYTYDNNHNMKDIIDPSGIAVARNVYDEDGRLVATIDADGNRIEYEHDIDGRTEIVRDKKGNASVYLYDDYGNILQKTDALGNKTTNTFDENGNMLTTTDALGNTISYNYDSDNNLLSETDSLGNTTYYSYNSYGFMTGLTDAKGYISNYSYDDNMNLISETDKLGNAMSYGYDEKGNITEEKIGDIVVKYTYDSYGNKVTYTDELGNKTHYLYDEKGNIVTETTEYKNYMTSVKKYEYDEYDNLISETNNGIKSYQLNYDVNGKLISKEDEYGNKTEYTYDYLGNKLTETLNGKITGKYTYDANGNITEYTDKNENITRYTYDSMNQVTLVKYSDETYEKFVYDKVGNMVSHTGRNGLLTQYEYDAKGNKTKEYNNISGTVKYYYDANSNIIKKTDSEGNDTIYEYDANGNNTSVIYCDGTSESYTYDEMLNKTSYTDRNGYVYRYIYDDAGNLLQVKNSLGNITKYSYDSQGNLLSITDANNNTTSYMYDINGNQLTETLPNGNTKLNSYNASGKLISTKDFNGASINYEYDKYGNLIKKSGSDGSYVIYEYDSDNNIISTKTENGTEIYEWNEDDLLKSKTDINGNTIYYEYDIFGNITEITTENNKLCYTYDKLDRMTSVTDKNNKLTAYSYDTMGNLVNIIRPNGVNTEYTYNDMYELTEVTNSDSQNTLISSYEYTLGNNGERIKVVENTGRKVEYEYDSEYELTKEKISDTDGTVSTIQYTYDAAGNRLTKNKDGEITNYTYNSTNALIKEGNKSYTYDKNGNLTSVDDGNIKTGYSYNIWNQLKSVSFGGVKACDYIYDVNGNRVRETDIADNSPKNYIWDTNREISQIIEEYDGENRKDYIYGDVLMGYTDARTYNYYMLDGQLSVRQIINDEKIITDSYTYDAFGNISEHVGDSSNDMLYNCQQYNHKTNLYYLRARYMNPVNGTFLSRDAYSGNVFEPNTLHKYNYASNNPVNFSDPLGLWIQKVIQGILAHRFINIEYVLTFPTHKVNYDRLFGRIGEKRHYRYVDIIDYTTNEIYEIKPEGGVVDGAKQVGEYLDILNDDIEKYSINGNKFILGKSWPEPGFTYYRVWPFGGYIKFRLAQDGLIKYEVIRGKKAPAYTWAVLKDERFNVKSLAPEAVILILAASIPSILRWVAMANTINYSFAF